MISSNVFASLFSNRSNNVVHNYKHLPSKTDPSGDNENVVHWCCQHHCVTEFDNIIESTIFMFIDLTNELVSHTKHNLCHR